MNERIRELLKQATKAVDPENRVWVFSKVDQAKFAELIVRECANIDFRREVGLTADDDYEIGKVIKEHFGVES
jgi:hypothetical protein